MDCLNSSLPAKSYLSSLRTIATLNFAMWDHYACGFVIGPFFSVAYHSPYEWNRRITRECNRAWGYVKDQGDSCEVHFIRGKGLLTPLWMILMILLCRFVLGFGSNAYVFMEAPWLLWAISVAAALITCGVSAIESSITEEGETGAGVITMILKAPHEFHYC